MAFCQRLLNGVLKWGLNMAFRTLSAALVFVALVMCVAHAAPSRTRAELEAMQHARGVNTPSCYQTINGVMSLETSGDQFEQYQSIAVNARLCLSIMRTNHDSADAVAVPRKILFVAVVGYTEMAVISQLATACLKFRVGLIV